MSAYLSQEDFFDRYFGEFGDGLEPTESNLELVREFLLEKWRDRAREMGVPESALPVDLSDSCKFTALFGSVVFAADIGGNWDHVFNLVDGDIVDINASAADVVGRADIYRHDADFIGGGDFQESAASCIPRISDWLGDFALVLRSAPVSAKVASPL